MAEVEGFYRFCVHCTTPIREERLRRKSTTCSDECRRLDRKSLRREQRRWRLEELAKGSVKLRKALEKDLRLAQTGASA